MKAKIPGDFVLFLLLLVLCACHEKSDDKNLNALNEKTSRLKAFHSCLDDIDRFQKRYISKTEEYYRRIDTEKGVIKKGQATLFKRGRPGGGAVLLMHGILSFPAAMELLIDELNQAGMTVLAPLITGFGSSVKVANNYDLSSWQKVLDTHYKALSKCFPKISLMGFSLGGALSTEFTLTRYADYLHLGYAQLSSLVLLSPAIKPAEKFVWLKARTTLLFTDEVPFSVISRLKNDPEIQEMMKDPENYNQSFPVYVGVNLKRLSETLEDLAHLRFHEHDLPVSLDYSEADKATDWCETRRFLTEAFFDVRIFSYTKESEVSHGLELDKLTPVGSKIRRGLARFVKWYNKESTERDNLF